MCQLSKIFIRDMFTEKKRNDILLFSKNRHFLYETLFNSALQDDTNQALQKNRALIIHSICCQRSTTDYPNKYDLKNILNRIQSAQSLLDPYLDCISKSDNLRSLSACFLQDYRLVERIWLEYPYLRPYFYHIDGLKQLELIQTIASREKPLEYLDDILEKLEVVNKYYREDKLNFDALYLYVLQLNLD